MHHRIGARAAARAACALLALLACNGAAAGAGAPARAPRVAQDSTPGLLRALLASARHPWARWPDFPRYVDDVAALYASRADAPLWHRGAQLSPAALRAIGVLARAAADGLDPRDYDARALDSLALRTAAGALAADDRIRFDVLLTLDLVRYVDDLRGGRTHPAPLGRAGGRPPFDLAAAVAAAANADSVPGLVAAARPPLFQYRNLQRLLAQYRALAADSTLVPLVPADLVRPGDRYAGVAALGRRLATVGDLAADAAPRDSVGRYQGPIVDAVRRFQLRHALAVDGVLGPATFAALAVPFAWRVREIEMALERLRWLPPLSRRRIAVVNIPAFELFAFDSAGAIAEPALEMKVIVGRALDRRTPVLFEEMRYVDFRPYWNVPRSILVGELLPALRRHPGYLRENDMELVGPRDRAAGNSITAEVLRRLARGELRVRQRPGPANALGLVKFVFPNDADVYMHATPSTELFARARRDFSHGCIRVEDPVGLAEWVLGDQPGWTRDSIEAAMQGPRTVRALLTRPLPVAILYTTAVAHPDGTARFYADIYEHDRALDDALRAGPTPP